MNAIFESFDCACAGDSVAGVLCLSLCGGCLDCVSADADDGMRVSILFVLATSLIADGGGVVTQKTVSGLRVMVVVNPLPMSTGREQIAVLVEAQRGSAPVQDARVAIRARSPESRIQEFEAAASQMQDGWYSLREQLPAAGKWEFEVLVERGGVGADVPVQVSVEAWRPGDRRFRPADCNRASGSDPVSLEQGASEIALPPMLPSAVQQASGCLLSGQPEFVQLSGPGRLRQETSVRLLSFRRGCVIDVAPAMPYSAIYFEPLAISLAAL
jgi:hypothetical protein